MVDKTLEFEYFNFKHKTGAPLARISNSGFLIINKAAVQIYGISKRKFAKIGYNNATHAVSIRFVNEKINGSRKVNLKKEGYCRIWCIEFLRRYGITKTTARFELHKLNDDVLYFYLRGA